MEDSVGGVYPIFANLFKHDLVAYIIVTFFSSAFIPTSEIYTTPVPLLSAIKKPIQDWTNRPLSTSKLLIFTPSTPKYESVSSSQMMGSITYGTLKKHIYIHIRKIYCVQAYLRHINVLKHISLLTIVG
jgi:hypothetical protein